MSERRHPLVARLTDGVLIYSRSFWLDFWLVYKNQHIVVSTFACHPAHFFTKTDRFWVCVASLFVAFGVSGWLVAGISESWAESRRDECTRGAGPWAGAPCFNASGAPLPRTDDGSCPQGALCDPQALRKADLRDIVILSALSCCLQVFYDYFSALFVTCGCVQNGCPAVVRACFEGLGKFAFFVLFVIALLLFVVGLISGGSNPHEWAVSFTSFVSTKIVVFSAAGSLTLLVMFFIGRAGQLKPEAGELQHSAAVRRKWMEKRWCLSAAPCTLWNRYIGEDKFFNDLPDTPPDYDFALKVGLCCSSLTWTVFEYKGKDTIEMRMGPDSVHGQAGPPESSQTASASNGSAAAGFSNTHGHDLGRIPGSLPPLPPVAQAQPTQELLPPVVVNRQRIEEGVKAGCKSHSHPQATETSDAHSVAVRNQYDPSQNLDTTPTDLAAAAPSKLEIQVSASLPPFQVSARLPPAQHVDAA